MKLKELTALLNDVTVQSTDKVLCAIFHVSAGYSKTQAYSLYGRSNIDRWLKEGLIRISDKKIDRKKLEVIAAASNRNTYLPVADRKLL